MPRLSGFRRKYCNRVDKMVKNKKKIKKKKKIDYKYGKPIRKQAKTFPAGSSGRRLEKGPAEEGKKRKYLILTGVAGIFLVVLAGIYLYIIQNYTITTVYVEGNIHYDNEEIIEMVMDGAYGKNSLFLSMKYENKSIEGIPFVEKMDVSVLDPHTVKIEVYEKALAGYVEYLERYMYFDKDGIIVESSTQKTPGVPMVTGLSFDHVILHQPLPVEDIEVFKDILSITQLVNKHNLSIDRIYFGHDASLTLYFDSVKVALGSRDYLEEKVMQLQYMLPELSGKSGTLRMENYAEGTKTITFEPD